MTNSKGFFDTNIFVGISLLKKVELFFEEFISVKIAEQVYDEFDKWNVDGFSYKYIYTDAVDKVASKHIEVVELNSFDERERQYINYKTDEIKNGVINNADLGEIYSVLMADIHEAPYFCTNDNNFIKKNKETHFPHLKTKNLRDILETLHENDDEEMISELLKKERQENQKMVAELKNISSTEKYKIKNGFDNVQLEMLNKFKNNLS